MTQSSGSYYGGIEYLTQRENTLDQIARILAAALFDYGHHIERQSTISPTHARIQFNGYTIDATVQVLPTGDSGNDSLRKLDLTLRANGLDEDIDHAQLLLVVMLYRAAEALRTQKVMWLDPDVVLTAQQFKSAFAGVSPVRSNAAASSGFDQATRFTPIEDSEDQLGHQYEALRRRSRDSVQAGLVEMDHDEALRDTFRHDPLWEATAEAPEETSAALRLSSWAMTFMLVFLSAPIAAAMAAVNLMRGEDFRLNTQVMSYTALVFAADSTNVFGALAQALSV